MDSPYHSGELEVQERAGVRDMAARIGRGIHATIPPAARDFLRNQPMAIAATVDAEGSVWASLLTGPPGFVESLDERTVRLATVPGAEDPLAANLRLGGPIGILAIELATRRRMRLNGRAETRGDGLYVRAEEVFSNCPKYIQAREWEPEGPASPGRQVWRGDVLDDARMDWIDRADTFFVASYRPEVGADASHRGGRQGFVRIVDERTLVWPDYQGNNMFQTLGNIAAYPRAGLLFLDFDTGRTLQLSGRARIDWDRKRAAEHVGAERLVEFTVESAIVADRGDALRWRFLSASSFNPE